MLKIEELGEKATEKAIEYKAMGLTYQAIADRLNGENDSQLTDKDIRDFLVKRKKLVFEVAAKEETLNQRLTEQYFNTIESIKQLHSEMWDMFYKMKAEATERNWKDVISAANQILKQIEHVDKILGRLQTGSINISYNYVDMSKKIAQIIPQTLIKLQDRGAIKIKNKRLVEELIR